MKLNKVGSLDINNVIISHGKPNGLGWFTAALFLIADMAGGGIVALPVAMARSGTVAGITITILSAITFCYTAHILSENWIIMCDRWNVYTEHCRKPYPEMAYRAMGVRARSICSVILNVVLFGITVVYCLLSSHIINNFIVSVSGYDIGFCFVLLLITLAIYPVTLLRSPQDFWWAVVVAMLTTLISVIMIIAGSLLDFGNCTETFNQKSANFEGILASLGTFMFGYGGHIVFPSVQHDMKHPKQFSRSAKLAFLCITVMYVSISLIGYTTYGNSLQNSVIDSIQFVDFGWHRIAARTAVILAILLIAETVPKFGPILNVIGATTTALTSAVLPLIYNHYLKASLFDLNKKNYIRPTLINVLQRNSKSRLLLDCVVIVTSVVLSAGSSYTAIIEMASTEFTMPCYLFFLDKSQNVPATLSGSVCDHSANSTNL